MASSIRLLPNLASDAVLVCRKCSKKLGGGFGARGTKRLGKVLARELGATRKLGKAARSRPVVIETGCLGVCPKGEVVAVRAGETGRVLLVAPGATPASVARALGFGDEEPS